MLFGRGTFWVLPLTYFPKGARAYPFPPICRNSLTVAAAPLVLTPFVRNQKHVSQEVLRLLPAPWPNHLVPTVSRADAILAEILAAEAQAYASCTMTRAGPRTQAARTCAPSSHAQRAHMRRARDVCCTCTCVRVGMSLLPRSSENEM